MIKKILCVPYDFDFKAFFYFYTEYVVTHSYIVQCKKAYIWNCTRFSKAYNNLPYTSYCRKPISIHSHTSCSSTMRNFSGGWLSASSISWSLVSIVCLMVKILVCTSSHLLSTCDSKGSTTLGLPFSLIFAPNCFTISSSDSFDWMTVIKL